ncbi:MAG: aldehyde dehydrogenase family protein [Acidobacteriota bacterium]
MSPATPPLPLLAERSVPDFEGPHGFLDGEPEDGRGAPFETVFPVTGEVLATLPSANPEDVDRAVISARRCFRLGSWRRLDGERRAEVFERLAEILLARQDELVQQILFDNGKTAGEARIDVLAAVGGCQRAAARCRQEAERRLPAERGVDKLVWREPVGVVAGLTPYNAPLMFASLKALPALAMGNSVVLKVSERAPLVARELCRAASEAGLQPGALNLVHGGVETAAALSAHSDVDLISITGGTTAGTAVMQAAAPTIKNLLLELGGKSAHIILADADLDQAVAAAVAGIFRNAGQRCFSGSRLLVDRRIADEVEARVIAAAEALVVGDPFDPATQVGPMIDQRAVQAAEQFVARAVADGVHLATGGTPVPELGGGSFFRPTVLTGAHARSYAAQEELFGPVLTVLRVDGVDQAIAVANDSPYGLAGGVWTGDEPTALRIAREVRCGYFWINTYGAIFGDVPFGGYGRSGLGREAGEEGFDAYSEQKTVLIDRQGGASAPMF